MFEPLDRGSSVLGCVHACGRCQAACGGRRAMGACWSWAVDCAAQPTATRARSWMTRSGRTKGDVPAQFRRGQGRSEVVSATVNTDGLLNVMVYFPSLQQTREFGLLLSKQGSCARSTIAASAASTRSGTANTSRQARQHPHNSAAINSPEAPSKNVLQFLRNVHGMRRLNFAFYWRRTS